MNIRKQKAPEFERRALGRGAFSKKAAFSHPIFSAVSYRRDRR